MCEIWQPLTSRPPPFPRLALCQSNPNVSTKVQLRPTNVLTCEILKRQTTTTHGPHLTAQPRWFYETALGHESGNYSR
jgi:hypothetical protein